MDSMAASFGVSTDFLDEELAEFIVAGRLTAKIDKVAGVIETNRWIEIGPALLSTLCWCLRMGIQTPS